MHRSCSERSIDRYMACRFDGNGNDFFGQLCLAIKIGYSFGSDFEHEYLAKGILTSQAKGSKLYEGYAETSVLQCLIELS